jgi:PAS domain S-box-containing protein
VLHQKHQSEPAGAGLRIVGPLDLRNRVQPGHSGWRHWRVRYGAALLATAVSLGIWSIWPTMQRDPFILLIVAVILTARFFGFGPALFGTFLSVACLDLLVFRPIWHFALDLADLERLLVFVLVSVISASIARQRSRAEIRAGDARQRMAAIVESSDDAIFSTRRDGTITSWNHGAETLYGYSADEILGRSVALVVPPERSHEVFRHQARLNRGEHIDSFQTERMRKDGSRVSVLLSISPLRDSQNHVVGSSGIARDITAQKHAEEALLRSEKLATAGRLSAAIAHEINNPLEAVLNLLYLARRDPLRAEHYLNVAEKEVQRVAAIAQQTLGLVRESAAPVRLRVTEIVEDVLQLYTRKLDAKRVHIAKRYCDDVEIQGFPGELRQVFSNLIANAIDAMREGGFLQLRIWRSHEWSEGSRSGVRIVISDDGSGIAPAQISHIFDPFYTTKGEVGTGLGLWLSHRIIQKHQGWIRVRSSTRLGQSGTIFTLFLPDPANLSYEENRESALIAPGA